MALALLNTDFFNTLIILIFSIFLGCATIPKVEIIEDKFDNHVIYRKDFIALGGNSGFLSHSAISHVRLALQKFVKSDIIVYHLIVRYGGENWLFIPSGESLVMLIDGERKGFSGDGSERHREVVPVYGAGVVVIEKAWYEISPDDLIKIANAREVKVKITGGTYFLERYFTEENFEYFVRFVKDYVKK